MLPQYSYIADQKLVAQLKNGTGHWNAFRQRALTNCVNLNGVCLSNTDLAGADLHRALLIQADLRNTKLEQASMECAVLRQANLSGANLASASLNGADLFKADLSGANLQNASVELAFLKSANLSGADLSTTRGLTPAQLEDASGDLSTKLPPGFSLPSRWLPITRSNRPV